MLAIATVESGSGTPEPLLYRAIQCDIQIAALLYCMPSLHSASSKWEQVQLFIVFYMLRLWPPLKKLPLTQPSSHSTFQQAGGGSPALPLARVPARRPIHYQPHPSQQHQRATSPSAFGRPIGPHEAP